MGCSKELLVVCLCLLQFEYSQTRVLVKRSSDVTASAASFVVNKDTLNAYQDAERVSNVCKNCMQGARQRRDVYTQVLNRKYVPQTINIKIPLVGPYHKIKEIIIDNSGLHQQKHLPSNEPTADNKESVPVQSDSLTTITSDSIANILALLASEDRANASAATVTLSDTKIISTDDQSVTASIAGASHGSASAGGASDGIANSLSMRNSTDTVVETNSISLSAAKAASGPDDDIIAVTLKSDAHEANPDRSTDTSTSGSTANSKSSGDNTSAQAISATLSNINTTVIERKAISVSEASGNADDNGSTASATSGSSSKAGSPTGASATDSYATGTASGLNSEAHAATLALVDTSVTNTDTTSLSVSAARAAGGHSGTAAAEAGGHSSSDGSAKSLADSAASGDDATAQTISASLSDTNTATSHTQSISGSAANAQSANGTATAAAGSASKAVESPENLLNYKHTTIDKPTDKISFEIGPSEQDEECDDDTNTDKNRKIVAANLEGEHVDSDSHDSGTENPKSPESKVEAKANADAAQSESED